MNYNTITAYFLNIYSDLVVIFQGFKFVQSTFTAKPLLKFESAMITKTKKPVVSLITQLRGFIVH